MTHNNKENPQRQMVRKSIGYGQRAYDNHIHKYFVTWCEEMAQRFYHKDRDLIQNEALFRWYAGQWEILVERAMLQDYGAYMARKIPDTRQFFYKILCEYAEALEQYYPASLMRTGKKANKSKYNFNPN